jgi:hypothetical protein
VFDRFSTFEAKKASFRRLATAFGTEQEGQGLMAMRTFHLLLLNTEILDKSFDVSPISPKILKQLSRPFIRKEAIQVHCLPGKERIEVDFFSSLFRLSLIFLRMLLFFHKNPFLYRIRPSFCQLCLALLAFLRASILKLIEPVIQPPLGHQVLMLSDLSNLSFVEHNDSVRMLNGRESMGYDESRSSLEQPCKPS